jgi:16S rRNA (uracil1498-N3)-methyltransferase
VPWLCFHADGEARCRFAGEPFLPVWGTTPPAGNTRRMPHSPVPGAVIRRILGHGAPIRMPQPATRRLADASGHRHLVEHDQNAITRRGAAAPARQGRRMTTVPRLYVPAPLAAHCAVAASPAQAHYLGTVLRYGPGDPVRLFNGQDGEWHARIAERHRDRLTLAVEHQHRQQEAEPDLWLAFALLKRDATDLVVQKATELGASQLWPVITERTNAARLNETRLTAIATEAAEQCERLTIPVLHPPCRLPDLLAGWPPGRPLHAAIERATAAAPRATGLPAALLVGPEGGFTPGELDAMLRHPFVTPVSLGPRILRAETACVAGLALLQAPWCG